LVDTLIELDIVRDALARIAAHGVAVDDGLTTAQMSIETGGCNKTPLTAVHGGLNGSGPFD
jgi:hypothetical protein